MSTTTTHQSSVSPKCSETLRSEILESVFCLFNFLHITIYPAATSCLGRAITFASIVVKKIYTYYISFNISQAWYSSKNHLTLDMMSIDQFLQDQDSSSESSLSTTLSNLHHQQLCRIFNINNFVESAELSRRSSSTSNHGGESDGG